MRAKGIQEEPTPRPLCNSNNVRELQKFYNVKILFIVIMVLTMGGGCRFWRTDKDGDMVTSSQNLVLERQGKNTDPYFA